MLCDAHPTNLWHKHCRTNKATCPQIGKSLVGLFEWIGGGLGDYAYFGGETQKI
jgi:hypothetical protein